MKVILVATHHLINVAKQTQEPGFYSCGFWVFVCSEIEPFVQGDYTGCKNNVDKNAKRHLMTATAANLNMMRKRHSEADE